MTLGETQELFSSCLATLILKLNEARFGVRGKEWLRTADQAAIYAAHGLGVKNSVHCDGLAVDLVLTFQGQVLTKTEDYQLAGTIWKSLNPLCRWGGDFTKLKDGGHFSFEWQGRM